MKVCIWTNMPNHYQPSYFSALREEGVDLQVCYYEQVPQWRLAMGWKMFENLPAGEQYVPATLESLDRVPDANERIHVVPGYGNAFLRALAAELSRRGVPWVHWSEPGHPGLRWWLLLPRKLRYARLVNRQALGAFGIGQNALVDCARWGIRTEKLAMLPYSTFSSNRDAAADTQCCDFAAGRLAFIYLGALCYRKATDVLLKAFADVARQGVDAVLLLVGNDKSNGEYVRLAQSLGIADRVLFRGPVSPDALSGVLRCAQVLVLPSRFDGWGVVLNEGASMGLALIGSDRTGASQHLIESGGNGFVVRAGSVSSLAAAMNAYGRAPLLAETHGKQSLEFYANYSARRNAKRFVSTVSTWLKMSGCPVPEVSATAGIPAVT